jgi:hypothetical protein
MEQVKTDMRWLALVASGAGFLLGLSEWHRSSLLHSGASLDGLVLSGLAGTAFFAAAFAGGHFALRRLAAGGGAFYALAGAVAALIAFFGTTGPELVRLAGEQKLISLAIGLPLLAGALLGAVYRSGAGTARSDPGRIEAIETALETHGGAEPALLSAGGDRYYSGPMQVRFSLSLMFASGGLLGAIMAAVAILLMLTGNLMDSKFVDDGLAVQSIGVAVSMTVGLAVLMVIPTLIGHYAARYFKATSAGAYVGYGFLANVLLGLVTGVFLFAAPFAAGSLALYRRLAGLEPVGLPDDVSVRDARALVPADHPARRYHRVVARPEPSFGKRVVTNG